MSCTTTHTATNEAMPAVVYHPYHRDFGTHPLPTDRSALLNEQREYKTYVTNYQTDVWDVERGGADEDFYGCIERLNALDAAIAQLPPDNSDEAMVTHASKRTASTAPSRTRTTPSGTARDGLLSTRRGTHRARASTASLPSGTSPRTSRKRPSAAVQLSWRQDGRQGLDHHACQRRGRGGAAAGPTGTGARQKVHQAGCAVVAVRVASFVSVV